MLLEASILYNFIVAFFFLELEYKAKTSRFNHLFGLIFRHLQEL